MKRYTLISFCCFAFALLLVSCNNEGNNKEADKTEVKTPKIKEETVTYSIDSLNMNNYVAFDENVEGKRPAVLVIHEWWGLNDYTKRRAKMLALGIHPEEAKVLLNLSTFSTFFEFFQEEILAVSIQLTLPLRPPRNRSQKSPIR